MAAEVQRLRAKVGSSEQTVCSVVSLEAAGENR